LKRGPIDAAKEEEEPRRGEEDGTVGSVSIRDAAAGNQLSLYAARGNSVALKESNELRFAVVLVDLNSNRCW
jgi:hypothetical protein